MPPTSQRPSRILTNHYPDFQLQELGRWLGDGSQRGPYLISQDGAAPEDPQQRHCTFVLTRRGTWLHYYLFLALPEEVRRRCALFDTTREALECAGGLSGGPRVEDAHTLPELIRDAGFAPAESDALGRALLEDLQRRHPQAPVRLPGH